MSSIAVEGESRKWTAKRKRKKNDQKKKTKEEGPQSIIFKVVQISFHLFSLFFLLVHFLFKILSLVLGQFLRTSDFF